MDINNLKFWKQTPQEKKASNVLAEINKAGEDYFIRKTDSDLANDLAEGINKTKKYIKKMDIPMGDISKIGKTTDVPLNK